MKDQPSQCHSNVAATRKAQQSPADGSNYNLQCDSSFSDDNDWDTGKLVIDLDVDTSKSPQKSTSSAVSPKKSAVVALTRSPIKAGNSMEHHATVDKGLKMKITKRKNAGAKSDIKGHEIVRNEQRGLAGLAESIAQNPTVNLEKMKTTCDSTVKDKGPKNRANSKDKKATKERNVNKQSAESGLANGNVFPCPGSSSSAGNSHNNSASAGMESNNNTNTEGEASVKSSDPYEFNAKVEDRVNVPRMKKIKVEKCDVPANIGMKDIGVETCSQGAMTDPDCLGPCEPGTSVTLEGIVWQETENGMLVVNVTWRGKTYVGTLLDATKHDWAPPRLGCDSPTNEIETRTPKGRGKRGRGGPQGTTTEVNSTDRRLRKGNRRRNSGVAASTPTFTAPPSPAKTDNNSLKRKTRPSDLDLSEAAKKSKTCSNSTKNTPTSGQDEFIECPEPNCSKKYKHINGLRYHQSHAHQNSIDDNGEIIKEEKMDVTEKDTDKSKEESKPKDEQKETVKETEKVKQKPEKSVKGKKKASKDKESKTAKESKSEESESAKSTGSQGKVSSQADEKSEAEVKKSATNTDSKETSESTKAVPATVNKSTVEKPLSNTENVSKSETVKSAELITSQSDCKSPMNNSAVISNNSPGRPVVHYQISGPEHIAKKVVSVPGQTVGAGVGTITTKVGPQCNIAAIPVTVVTATTVDIPKADDKIKNKTKQEKSEKGKAKGSTANRPIVPAPSIVSQGGLATVTSHTQMSPITTSTTALKPIQPKPTIMGEPSVNPALSSLKDIKDKKPKKKKSSKDKDAKEMPKDLTCKDTLPKVESMSVIKSAPAASLVPPTSRVVTELHKSDSGRDVQPGRSLLAPMKDKPPLLVQQPMQQQQAVPGVNPPVSLALKSPIPQTVVEENNDRENSSSDVHSPAYSDISDANDSAPTLESENDLDRNMKSEAKGPADGSSVDKNQDQNMSRGYPMYSNYYAQPPYLVPAVQPTSNPKPVEGAQSAIKETPKKPENPGEKPGQPRKEMEPRELNTGSPLPANLSTAKGSVSSAPSPHADMQRMQLFQQYLLMANMNQEAAYHMTLMTSDPNYRAQYEKSMKDQQQRGPMDKDGEKRLEKSRQAPETISRPPSEPSMHHQQVRESGPRGPEPKPDNKPPALISDRERTERDRAEKERQQALQRERENNLKEKRNENLQILKENMELKPQMGSDQYRHEQDMHRLMWSQQHPKMSRVDDSKPIDARKLPEYNSEHGHKDKPSPHEPRPDLKQDMLRSRSPSTGPQPKDLSSPKPGVDKARHDEKMSSASPRSTPKPKEGSSVPPPAGYPPYMQHAYLQSPHYPTPQVPYDPSQSLYRGPVMGFSGPPAAYIHPSQVRYVNPGEPGIEKEKMAISPNTPVSEAQSKEPMQAHGPHYYGAGPPQHKIHELKDVGKSGEHPSPSKSSSDGERQTSPFNNKKSDSPPTQRHLHSHHHTHVVTPGYIYDPYQSPARLRRPQERSGIEQLKAFIGQPGMPPSHYVPK